MLLASAMLSAPRQTGSCQTASAFFSLKLFLSGTAMQQQDECCKWGHQCSQTRPSDSARVCGLIFWRCAHIKYSFPGFGDDLVLLSFAAQTGLALILQVLIAKAFLHVTASLYTNVLLLCYSKLFSSVSVHTSLLCWNWSLGFLICKKQHLSDGSSFPPPPQVFLSLLCLILDNVLVE